MCMDMVQVGDVRSEYDVAGFGASGKVHCRADTPYSGIHAGPYVYFYDDSDELMSENSYCILPSRKEMIALLYEIL